MSEGIGEGALCRKGPLGAGRKSPLSAAAAASSAAVGRSASALVALLAVCCCATLCAGAGAAGGPGGAGGSGDAGAYFPDLEGWTKDGVPSIYDSETLYEYIDGAADLYLSYGFQDLAALYYERGEEQGISVDIYRHSTTRNAFGIYSQERPAQGRFLDIGAQGYYENGILNFVLGSRYVKLSGYSLGEEDEALLKSLAKDVASRLGESPGFPKAIEAFPDSGKVANSEKFIATSFMGHGFLRSAFVADYVVRKQELKLFIIEADDEAVAKAMLESYIKLAKDRGQPVESEGALHRLKDPYQGSKGAVNLMIRGRYVWGMLSDDPSIYEFYLKETEEGLKRAGLL